ncbi:DUF6802 family protein [Actinomycetospora rhizophila]|uniref:DUF6802 family protein n=1 Tax=Actinomycetospora rhizophila TaxID=1416876 RepID=A0ABV9Z990_9PSEU
MVDVPELHPEAFVDPAGPAPELLIGAHALGAATVDSDADGRPDTAVVPEPDALVLGTDLDGDARVDVVTRVHDDGRVTTEDLAWDEGPVPPAPTIDPATGRWVRGG